MSAPEVRPRSHYATPGLPTVIETAASSGTARYCRPSPPAGTVQAMIATRRRRTRLWFVTTFLLSANVDAFELEMGAVTVNDTFTVPAWTNVTFLRSFSSTPLVFALPTTDGSDPATVRIRNVTPSGFQILQVEPSANDGPHVAMSTAYLAIERGDHRLPDGSRLLALEHPTTSFANRLLTTTWDSLVFPAPFSATPAMLGSIQTTNNESATPPSTSLGTVHGRRIE